VTLDALVEASGTTLPPEVREAWDRFGALVVTWSKKTDLVSAKDPEGVAEVLFWDALTLLRAIPQGAHLVDVGAGAGAPAIPVALARPDLRLTMVEPRRRRVAFVRTAVGTLGLGGRAEVREGRFEAETIAPGAVLMSRATFAPAEWLTLAAPVASRVLVLLGREAPPELEGWAPIFDESYPVPRTGAARRLVAYEARRS